MTKMTFRDKILISLIFFIAISAALYTVRTIISPFIFSLILAYLLSPPVNYLNKYHKVSRSLSTLLILTIFLTATGLLCAYIIPITYNQLNNFINTLPAYMNIIQYDVYPKFANFIENSGFNYNKNYSELIYDQEVTSKVINFSKSFFNKALLSSFSLVNAFSLIILTPILVFYLIKDWEVMINTIKKHLPKKSAKTIKKIFKDIDHTLSQYIRGQLNICIMLGLFYAILLNFSGLNFGFLIGFLTGLFTFVPYVGMLVGVVIGIVVALFQWGFDPINISIIAAIFATGQFIEGNFITPKLIGDKIGIHPVWIIFGLFFFGITLGVIGVVIAVPLTAIIGVLVKHFAAQYKKKYT